MKYQIVQGPLDAGKPTRPRYRTATQDGGTLRVRVVDADSPSFAADFQAAFRANVRSLRRENRLLDAAG